MSQKLTPLFRSLKGTALAKRGAALSAHVKALFLTFSIALLNVVLLPEFAAACSGCFTVRGEERFAFYGTTLLMILVPWSLMAGIAYWIYRAYRKNNTSKIPTDV